LCLLFRCERVGCVAGGCCGRFLSTVPLFRETMKRPLGVRPSNKEAGVDEWAAAVDFAQSWGEGVYVFRHVNNVVSGLPLVTDAVAIAPTLRGRACFCASNFAGIFDAEHSICSGVPEPDPCVQHRHRLHGVSVF
jgi:hypothetical protein